MTWRLPFPDSTLTGHFGKVRTFKGAPTNPHRGTDWAPGADTVIPNISAGEVALIRWSDVMGWGVIIKTDAVDPKDKKPWFVGYHHLSCATHGINCKGPTALGEHSPLKSTKVGDRKALSEPVGRIGNTGSASSGPHLHATLSKAATGAWSGVVLDLYKHITEMLKTPQAAPQSVKIPEPQPKIAEKVEVPVKAPPAPKLTITCPNCKMEFTHG